MTELESNSKSNLELIDGYVQGLVCSFILEGLEFNQLLSLLKRSNSNQKLPLSLIMALGLEDYFYDLLLIYGTNLYRIAASNGYLNLLVWCRDNGIDYETEVEQLWREEGYHDNGVCRIAAASGHLECLKWLISNNYPYEHELMCSYAAMGGQLETLHWLINHGGFGMTNVFSTAASCGSLNVLQWGQENGYDLNDDD